MQESSSGSTTVSATVPSLCFCSGRSLPSVEPIPWRQFRTRFCFLLSWAASGHGLVRDPRGNGWHDQDRSI